MNYPRQASCPCCLFPTLTENGAFEICVICWWEDDGQNGEDADDVRGGPNGRYSLTNARANFADHGHMYAKGQGIQAVERPTAERGELLEFLRSVGLDPKRADFMRLGELLSAEDRRRRTL